MKFIVILSIFFLISCSTGKKVFICGDRECINKKEAETYFAENLSLEIKVYKDKKVKTYDLVKLNTNDNFEKDNLNNKVKTDPRILSKKEKEIIKKKLAEEKKLVKLRKKQEKEKIKNLKKIKNKNQIEQKKNAKLKLKEEKKKLQEENKLVKARKDTFKEKKLVKETKKDKVDKEINKQVVQYEEICSLLNKCEIDEISDFLMKVGKNKDYPNLSIE